MGIGDQLIGTGLARGAQARGKRIAFGDGHKIIWDHNSPEIFKRNPNIAAPGQERASDLEWIHYCRGNRIYNKANGNRWIWNYDFKATPGEMFFSGEEERFGQRLASRRFVVIEPNVPVFKSVAPNKQWSIARYEEVADKLTAAGYLVVQLHYARMGPNRLKSASMLHSPGFRMAMSLLKNADLYIGAEGGMHHAAAAVGIPAVVLFGGFVPPQVLGYDTHTNLTGNSEEACGSFNKCDHCGAAMNAIEVDEVMEAALGHLRKAAA